MKGGRKRERGGGRENERKGEGEGKKGERGAICKILRHIHYFVVTDESVYMYSH